MGGDEDDICSGGNHKIKKLTILTCSQGSSILTENGLLLKSSVIVLSGADPSGTHELNILSLI